MEMGFVGQDEAYTLAEVLALMIAPVCTFK